MHQSIGLLAAIGPIPCYPTTSPDTNPTDTNRPTIPNRKP